MSQSRLFQAEFGVTVWWAKTNSHGLSGLVVSVTSVPSITPSPSVSGLRGLVPAANSWALVNPSLSQSKIDQYAHAGFVLLGTVGYEHGLRGSVPALISSISDVPSLSSSSSQLFANPSPSESGNVLTIVTIAFPVLTFPLLSVTVRVTVFGPILAQVKFVWLTVIEAIPQSSVDPLFTWAGVIVAAPVASNWSVIFWVVTIGTFVSFIVITFEQVVLFPEVSVTRTI